MINFENDKLPCPFCKEAIFATAIKCKHCKSFLQGMRSVTKNQPCKCGEVRGQSNEKAINPNAINQALEHCSTITFPSLYYTIDKVNGQFVAVPHLGTTEMTICTYPL